MLDYERAIVEAGIEPETPTFGSSYVAYDQFRKVLECFDRGDIEKGQQLSRDSFVSRFSFAIPDENALQVIAQHAPIVEVGCGTGYWAWELRKAGVDVIATDAQANHPQKTYNFGETYLPIEPLNGIEAVTKYPNRTMLLVWPCHNLDWAWKVLRHYSRDAFVYVGEGPGGCCADDLFWNLIEKEWEEFTEHSIPVWSGIHDYLAVFKRKGTSNAQESSKASCSQSRQDLLR